MNARRPRSLGAIGLACAGILIVIAAGSLLAPLIAPYDPLEQRIEERLQPPSSRHFFGTDGLGRDVFSRSLHAGRTSIAVALLSLLLAAGAGVPAGALCGYAGGTVDLVVQRFVDLLLGFPSLVLALMVVVSFGSSPVVIAAAIGLGLLPRVSRVARASALVIAEEPFILAARSLGIGRLRILSRHVIPGMLSPLLAQLSGYLGTAIIVETTLSFLGLGVPPPYPSWGRMLQEGSRQYFEAAPWVTLFPGLLIATTATCFALLGDSVRDVLDPRLSGDDRPRSRR